MFFLFAAFLFWVAVTIAIAYDSGVIAFFFLATFAAVLQVFPGLSSFQPIDYILTNPLNSILLTALYFGAGVVWVVLKWFSFVYQERDAYLAIKASGGYLGRSYDVPLKVRQHKSRIMRWMVYWPMSFVWTVIDDPIRRVFNGIYNMISGGLQSISDNAFKNA